MNALELLNSGSYKLQKQKIKTHRIDSEILLSKVLNKSREQILIRLNQIMKNTEVFAFDNLIFLPRINSESFLTVPHNVILILSIKINI